MKAAVALWVLAGWSTAYAADGAGALSGEVRVTRAGVAADASGVIVYVVGFNEPAPAEAAVIEQRDKRFRPDLLAITAGQRVEFPNDDPYFHNVFSPSPSRKFDLGQYPKGERKTKRFPKPGIVDVYCNIHPEMAATILVLPNRRFVRAQADGTFRIEGVPAGAWKVYAYSRRALAPVSAPVQVTAGETTRVQLALDEARPETPHRNKYGEQYRDPTRYP